jgi:arylformamidase
MAISTQTPTWPGDPPVSIDFTKLLAQGDSCNLSRLKLGAHTGTHLDAPYHFLETGRKVSEIPLETLIGPCRVLEVAGTGPIRQRDLESASLAKGARILFKTENSRRGLAQHNCFCTDYVALSLEAAGYLVAKAICLVGIDYLSVEPFTSSEPAVHQHLLRHNVVILEGLDLEGISAGEYELLCLPLKLLECESSPARVLLRGR